MGLRTMLGLKRRSALKAGLPPHWPTWFADKSFTSDWASSNFPTWAVVLSEFRNQHVEVLEIGSWEGRSAIFFLEFLPLSHITCIDTFQGQPERASSTPSIVQFVEARFDANLSPYGNRMEKMKMRSDEALRSLTLARRAFDVVLIDGSHDRDDVALDTKLSWPMLRPQGVLIWDDYEGRSGEPADRRPKPAIDAFLAAHDDCTELRRGYQVIVRRK